MVCNKLRWYLGLQTVFSCMPDKTCAAYWLMYHYFCDGPSLTNLNVPEHPGVFSVVLHLCLHLVHFIRSGICRFLNMEMYKLAKKLDLPQTMQKKTMGMNSNCPTKKYMWKGEQSFIAKSRLWEYITWFNGHNWHRRSINSQHKYLWEQCKPHVDATLRDMYLSTTF